MANKIYRTVIQFEILTEEPFEGGSLEDIAQRTFDGDASGRFLDNVIDNEELAGMDAVKAIKAQGSDPEFFGLNDKGEDIDF